MSPCHVFTSHSAAIILIQPFSRLYNRICDIFISISNALQSKYVYISKINALKIYVTVNSGFNGKSIIQLPLRRLGFLMEKSLVLLYNRNSQTKDSG